MTLKGPFTKLMYMTEIQLLTCQKVPDLLTFWGGEGQNFHLDCQNQQGSLKWEYICILLILQIWTWKKNTTIFGQDNTYKIKIWSTFKILLFYKCLPEFSGLVVDDEAEELWEKERRCLPATLYLYWNYSYSYVSYLNSLYKHSSLYPSMAPLSAALSLSSPGSSEEQGIMSASLNLNQLRPIHFSNFSFIFSSNNYFLRETLLLYKFVTIFTFHFTTNTENKGLVKLSLKGG